MSRKQKSSNKQPVSSSEEQEAKDRENKKFHVDEDDTVCTWPEGYMPRQPLYACLTCNPDQDKMAAICLGCYKHCHEGHDLVELYTKRRIRCDCGNSKFGNDNKCKLYAKKIPVNESNHYNHNFVGRFCKCDEKYDDPKTMDAMFQCEMCEDWFHLAHLGIDAETESWKRIHNKGYSLICTDCVAKYPFLAIFEKIKQKTCFKKAADSQKQPLNSVLPLKRDWRKLICDCSECEAFLESVDCTFLLDDDDDIEKYQENRKKARKVSDEDIVNDLVESGIRNTANTVSRGFNALKRNLGEFLDKIITPADVHPFFTQIKRPRLDRDAPDVE